MYIASKRNIPVIVPAPTDGSLGDILYTLYLEKKKKNKTKEKDKTKDSPALKEI